MCVNKRNFEGKRENFVTVKVVRIFLWRGGWLQDTEFPMALVVPVGCAGKAVSFPAHVSRCRRAATSFVTFATPSPVSGGEAAVDWVEATSNFFEKDTRPIMLFDGMAQNIF